MDSFDIFILLIVGALPLYLFGYLIGIKGYVHLIAGYKSGQVNDEEKLAKRVGIACFSGGSIFLVLCLYALFIDSVNDYALIVILFLAGLLPACIAIRALSKDRADK